MRRLLAPIAFVLLAGCGPNTAQEETILINAQTAAHTKCREDIARAIDDDAAAERAAMRAGTSANPALAHLNALLVECNTNPAARKTPEAAATSPTLVAEAGIAERASGQQPAWQLAAADDLTIAGVTIGMPLAVPECRSYPPAAPAAPADYAGGQCAGMDRALDDPSIKLVFFQGHAPPIGFGMRVYLKNGVVSAISFETRGADDQASVMAALRKKFGKPQTFDQQEVQNAFGRRGIRYYAEWLNQRAYVEFRGLTDKFDEGWVRIHSAAAEAVQREERKKLLRERPQL
jgi:hypothetical protein